MKSGLDVSRLACCDGQSRAQFSKGPCGHAHHDRGGKERQRRMHAAPCRRRPDQDVDSGTYRDAKPIEHRMRQRQRADQLRPFSCGHFLWSPKSP